MCSRGFSIQISRNEISQEYSHFGNKLQKFLLICQRFPGSWECRENFKIFLKGKNLLHLAVGKFSGFLNSSLGLTCKEKKVQSVNVCKILSLCFQQILDKSGKGDLSPAAVRPKMKQVP